MVADIYGGAEKMLGVKNWVQDVCAPIFPTGVLYKYNIALDHMVIPLRATTICFFWMPAFTKDLNLLWHIHDGFIPSSNFLCFPKCLQTDNQSLKKLYHCYLLYEVIHDKFCHFYTEQYLTQRVLPLSTTETTHKASYCAGREVKTKATLMKKLP